MFNIVEWLLNHKSIAQSFVCEKEDIPDYYVFTSSTTDWVC